MLLIDQLDFINPDHVTILCKDDRQLTIHISDGNSSVRLIYQLQQEDDTSQPLHKYMTSDAYIKARDTRINCDSVQNEFTYRDLIPNWGPPPHPPLQQSEPDSDGSSEPERPLRGM
jgi:hypothetical protein